MSFFASLLEGTANAAANSLGNYQKRQQVLDDDERNQAQAIDRYKQQQQIQLDMAEQARQQKQSRLQEQMAQAEEGGAKLTAGQALASLNKNYGSNLTEQDVLPEELAAHAPGQLAQIDNQRKAALNAGAYDAAEQLKQDYDMTVKALQQEYKNRRDEIKDNLAERKQDAMERKTDAQIAALGRQGSKDGATPQEKLNTELQALLRHRESLKDGTGMVNPEDASVKELDSRIRRVYQDIDKMRGRDTPANGAQAPAPAATKQDSAQDAPPVSALKPGVATTFKGMGSWTLVNGQPVRLK